MVTKCACCRKTITEDDERNVPIYYSYGLCQKCFDKPDIKERLGIDED
jgi:hypothetical protein